LTGNLAGVWKYRVGDFRIFAKIEGERPIIFVLEISHRHNAHK